MRLSAHYESLRLCLSDPIVSKGVLVPHSHAHGPCPGCGISLPNIDGPSHRYMISSPACWALYQEVMARAYESPDLQEVYRLAVDAYAVQHPGTPSRQSIQSVGVHLIRLCLFIEHQLPAEKANDMMLAAARYKTHFHWLAPPDHRGEITALNVHQTTTIAAYREHTRRWAHSAWQAWETHHDQVREWLQRVLEPVSS